MFAMRAFLGGGGQPSCVTDFFNGFELGSTFSGGPTYVKDYLDTLVKVPFGTRAIEGGELSYDFADGATLGPELVVNGDFSSTTGWIAEAGFSFSGGAAVGTNATALLYRAGVVVLTRTYYHQFTIGSISSGSVTPFVSYNNSYGTARTTVGTYGETITAVGSSTSAGILATSFTGTIDNISVKEIIPVWLPTNLTPSYMIPVAEQRVSYDLSEGATLGPEIPLTGNSANVTYSGGVATFTSAATSQGITNATGAATGKVYRVTFRVVSISGVIRSYAGSGTILSTATSTGTYTADGVASGTTSASIISIGTTTAVISNISYREIIPILIPTGVITYKAKYPPTFKGYLNEPARTNIYFPSAAPVTKNVTTTAQSYAVSCNGSGSVTLSGTMTGTATEGSPVIAVATAGTLTVTVSGTLAHVQIEAGTFVTSQIDTTTAAVNRPASNLTRPTAGVIPTNNFLIWGRVVPEGLQSGMTLFSARLSGSEALNIYQSATNIVRIQKYVGGTQSNACSVTASIAAGVGFEYQAYFKSTGVGLRVKVDGGSWTSWNENSTGVYPNDFSSASTYQIGATNNGSNYAGNYPFLLIGADPDPKARLIELAVTYAT